MEETMNTIRIGVIAGIAIALSTACTDVESDSVLTSGMYAGVVAESVGNGTTNVVAVLRVGGPTSTTFVDLIGDDELTATVDTDTQVMTGSNLGVLHSYSVEFEGDEPGTVYTVALNRTVDAGAPSSTMTMPEPFTLDPISDFSRAEDLTITWAPSGSGEDMLLEMDGSCLFFWEGEIDGDPGTYTIPANTLEQATDDTEDSCTVTLRLWRRSVGTVDPAFDDGYARGRQLRTSAAVSSP